MLLVVIVAPSTGAWIEIGHLALISWCFSVAPSSGAWIEKIKGA